MFKRGEYTLCGTVGVCQMEGIPKPDFFNNDKVYYNSIPESGRDTTIHIPVDSSKVEIREIMIKQEAEQFIPALLSVEGKQYTSDKERPQAYRQVFESDDCTRLASTVKEISEMEQNHKGEGKFLPIRERDGIKSTRKLLFGELATILSTCPGEIPDYVTNQIGEAW